MSASIPVAVAIIAVVILLVWREKNRQRRIDQEYDEMQLRIRGKGAWYAFYTIALYMAVYMVLEKTAGFALLSPADAVFLGMMLCGSVNVGYTILHDSYFGMTRSDGKNIGFLVIIAVMDVLCVVMLVRFFMAGAFSDLTRTIRDERILMVLCIPLFTTILASTLIRRLHPEEEDD